MARSQEVWFGLETGNLGDGTLNGDAPSGASLMEVGRATNHVAVQGRVILSTAFYDLSACPSVNGSADIWHCAVVTRNYNGTSWWVQAVLAPKLDALNANDADLEIYDSVAASTLSVASTQARDMAITWPAELLTQSAHVTPTAVDDALDQLIVRVVDGYRLMALCIWEVGSTSWPRSPVTLAGTNHYVEDEDFTPGMYITSDGTPATALGALSATQEQIFHRVRNVYNVAQLASNPRTTAVIGAAAAVNLYSGENTASPSRGPQEAGIPVDGYTGGYGNNTAVEVTCRVYASCAGGNGTVLWRSSLGEVTTGVGAIGAAAWYTATAKLDIDVSANVDGLGRTWDLVAPYGYVDAGTLSIYTVHVDVNPD